MSLGVRTGVCLQMERWLNFFMQSGDLSMDLRAEAVLQLLLCNVMGTSNAAVLYSCKRHWEAWGVCRSQSTLRNFWVSCFKSFALGSRGPLKSSAHAAMDVVNASTPLRATRFPLFSKKLPG